MSNQTTNKLSTRTLACCALLAALSVVFARLLIPMPDSSTRYSIEQLPIFLAGMLFGPMAGGLVGFTADFTGCLFSGYGFNPLFSVPPILYGVLGGMYPAIFGSKVNFVRLFLGLLIPAALGSVLYQSWALAFVYFSETFWQGFVLKLTTRSVQFLVTIIIDSVLLGLLFKANVFGRLGLWPRNGK